jgi:hypothetical protein
MISSKTGLLSSLVCPKLFDLPFVRIWKTSQNKTQTPLSRFKILYVFLFFFLIVNYINLVLLQVVDVHTNTDETN